MGGHAILTGVRRGIPGGMPEAKDPAIKLFGRTIPLMEAQKLLQPLPASAETPADQPVEVGDVEGTAVEDSEHSEKDPNKVMNDMEVNKTPAMAPIEGRESLQMSSSSLETINEDDHNTITKGNKAILDTKAENNTKPDGSAQEKVLKKPDKILPCPRCNSLDTKFCYYNNYNVNQPRHFCKNCQRYWTAGGTMRNVPVGAGRRKNKHSSSQYHHLVMPSDRMQPARLNNADMSNHPPLPCASASSTRPFTSNGAVLKFGPEEPLCESMTAALKIREENRNGDYNSMEGGRDNKEEPSCASSVTASNCLENGFSEHPINIEHNSAQAYCNGQTPLSHFQCYPGSPWAFPWPPGWNSIAAMAAGNFANRPENCNQNPVPWIAPVPFPFVPQGFWGCGPSWQNGAWTVPWAGANGAISPPSPRSNSGYSGNGSQTLGKHCRDASFQGEGEEKSEKSLWAPKTLRIDDPDEAAKSSIWATLGIKPEEGRIFKPFQSKTQSKVQTSDASQVLNANPAALSRSRIFQEST